MAQGNIREQEILIKTLEQISSHVELEKIQFP